MSERPWTEGPWIVRVLQNGTDCFVQGGGEPIGRTLAGPYYQDILDDEEYDKKMADSQLIAQAPEMYEMLERLEWSGVETGRNPRRGFCQTCWAHRSDGKHKEDCSYDALLTAANPSRKGGG